MWYLDAAVVAILHLDANLSTENADAWRSDLSSQHSCAKMVVVVAT